MKTIYLAGTISGMTFEECTDWREYVAERLQLHYDTLNPMRGKAYLKAETEGRLLEGAYEEHPLSTAKGITRRDHWDVRTCDIVLFNLNNAPRVSIGSMIEMGWASAYQKFIVTVLPTAQLHDHPMVRELSDVIVPTLEEAIKVLKAIAAP